LKPAGKKTYGNRPRRNKTPCTIKGIIMKKLFLSLSLCAATCLFASCGNDGKPARPRGRLQVQENGDSIEVRGPNGNVLIKGNQKNASIILNADDGKEGTIDFSTDTLVPDFPADIPILPDSTVTMNQVYQNGRNAIATLTTLKKTEKVIQFYEEQIPLKGWEPGARFDLDNIIMLNGTHNKASLNISITSANETTTINIARTEATD
jgi:hypothetical protein